VLKSAPLQTAVHFQTGSKDNGGLKFVISKPPSKSGHDNAATTRRFFFCRRAATF